MVRNPAEREQKLQDMIAKILSKMTEVQFGAYKEEVLAAAKD